MKLVFKVFITFLFSTLLLSCSSEKDNSPISFNINNEKFILHSSGGITIQNEDYPFENIIRSTFTIKGTKGKIGSDNSNLAVVNFDLFRKPTESISGVYTIFNQEYSNFDDFKQYVQTNNRACIGNSSILRLYQSNDSQGIYTFNNPSSPSTITITDNGNNSFSIIFNGNFIDFNGDFSLTGTVPVEMNITGTVQYN